MGHFLNSYNTVNMSSNKIRLFLANQTPIKQLLSNTSQLKCPVL
uniref:Uncharacterized protein n=1 Tax=Anguilla anguilla TaxID=7936 RepID=A0A0E9WLA8_ANGAN